MPAPLVHLRTNAIAIVEAFPEPHRPPILIYYLWTIVPHSISVRINKIIVARAVALPRIPFPPQQMGGIEAGCAAQVLRRYVPKGTCIIVVCRSRRIGREFSACECGEGCDDKGEDEVE